MNDAFELILEVIVSSPTSAPSRIESSLIDLMQEIGAGPSIYLKHLSVWSICVGLLLLRFNICPFRDSYQLIEFVQSYRWKWGEEDAAYKSLI